MSNRVLRCFILNNWVIWLYMGKTRGIKSKIWIYKYKNKIMTRYMIKSYFIAYLFDWLHLISLNVMVTHYIYVYVTFFWIICTFSFLLFDIWYSYFYIYVFIFYSSDIFNLPSHTSILNRLTYTILDTFQIFNNFLTVTFSL